MDGELINEINVFKIKHYRSTHKQIWECLCSLSHVLHVCLRRATSTVTKEKRQKIIFKIAFGGISNNRSENNMIHWDNSVHLQSWWRFGLLLRNYLGVKLPQKAKWLFWAHISGLLLVVLAGPFWESNEMCFGEPAERGTGENKANWSRKCHSLTLSQGDFNQKHS